MGGDSSPLNGAPRPKPGQKERGNEKAINQHISLLPYYRLSANMEYGAMAMTPQQQGYKVLAQAVLDEAKAGLARGDRFEWEFFESGWYRLFAAICDINDEVVRKEIVAIALPVADRLKVRVSDIILFEGELSG